MPTDLTELTGAYAAPWLPWIMIPLVFYILPFPVFAIIFLWIEREGDLVTADTSTMGVSSVSESSGTTSFTTGSTYSSATTTPSGLSEQRKQPQSSPPQTEAMKSADDQSHEAPQTE